MSDRSAVQIGAGIQIPPNAARVLQHFELEQKIRDSGAIQVNGNHLKAIPEWQDSVHQARRRKDGEGLQRTMVVSPTQIWLFRAKRLTLAQRDPSRRLPSGAFG